jgi:hypothetical protein
MSLLPTVDIMGSEYGDWDNPNNWTPIDASKQEIYMNGTYYNEDIKE